MPWCSSPSSCRALRSAWSHSGPFARDKWSEALYGRLAEGQALVASGSGIYVVWLQPPARGHHSAGVDLNRKLQHCDRDLATPTAACLEAVGEAPYRAPEGKGLPELKSSPLVMAIAVLIVAAGAVN